MRLSRQSALKVDAVERSGSQERTGNGWEGLAGRGGNRLAGKGGNGWEWLAGIEFGSSATTVHPFWEG